MLYLAISHRSLVVEVSWWKWGPGSTGQGKPDPVTTKNVECQE